IGMIESYLYPAREEARMRAHDPHRSWLMLGRCDAASRCGVDKSFKARAHFRWVDTTRCLHPLGYGERIKPLQASFAPANESATQAPGSLVRQRKGFSCPALTSLTLNTKHVAPAHGRFWHSFTVLAWHRQDVCWRG